MIDETWIRCRGREGIAPVQKARRTERGDGQGKISGQRKGKSVVKCYLCRCVFRSNRKTTMEET